MEVNINKYNPLRASSYIPLPKAIRNKGAVVNIQNNDNRCFGWAVTAGVITPKGPGNRTSSYPNCVEFLNFEGIDFPIKLRDISKFEAINPEISINVYGIDKICVNGSIKYEIVGPLYYTQSRKHAHVNLLLIHDEYGNSHYCYISDLSRLVSSQISSRNGKVHFCDGCLHYFKTSGALSQHSQFDCKHVYTELPTAEPLRDKTTGQIVPANLLKFNNFHKQLKVPFVVYADFESLLKPVHTSEPNPEKAFTIKKCEHEPHSFAYFIKCSYNDNLSKFEMYRGPNAATVFITRLETDVRNLYDKHLKHTKPMSELTLQEIQQFNNAVICYICENPFDAENIKVKDHCHLSGTYRGAAHALCNLHYKTPTFIPIFFHNLTGYDSHLFLKQLAQQKETIDVIAQNKEKYVSFSKHIVVDSITNQDGSIQRVVLRLRFLDSFRFLNFSLDTLAKNLPSDLCLEIRKRFSNDVQFALMRQKGVFPYSFVDSFDKLNEETLPPREAFFDTFRGDYISAEEYARASDVWKTLQCRTLGDYSDLYLTSDVLLLADVFENFRTVCQQHYKLDPAQYFTLPGFSWDAMLRCTSVQLELLTDMDMLHFFKKGIRGGVSTCVGRKAIANNPLLPNYDSTKPKSFLAYLDATNLYGWAMRQSLPKCDFQWLVQKDVEQFDVRNIADDSEIGYVLEIDLHYPQNLHDAHNDLPFCPENLIPPNGKSKLPKLIPNLLDKSRYIIHYRNLKQCLEHGLQLTKIYRILQFKQSAWLQPYIDLNTQLRNCARNTSEKTLFKLMNNSMFGKTMENLDKRVDVRLVTHWERIGKSHGAEQYIAKPNFKNLRIFSEELVAIEMNKVKITYDKPIYVGFSILDMSKIVIYGFYYDFLKSVYGKNVSLLYTDTDSLILEIYTENFYNDMKEHLHNFDTSNYESVNEHNISLTESVVGKMKDEYAGVPIQSFYGTGAKSYCVNVGNTVIKKAKGVTAPAIKNGLQETDFKSVVEENKVIFCKMIVFKSRLHTMYSEMVNKVALSSYDDKRYLLPGTTKTLAWGHRDISPDNESVHKINLLVQGVQPTVEDPTPDNDCEQTLDLFVELLQAALE